MHDVGTATLLDNNIIHFVNILSIARRATSWPSPGAEQLVSLANSLHQNYELVVSTAKYGRWPQPHLARRAAPTQLNAIFHTLTQGIQGVHDISHPTPFIPRRSSGNHMTTMFAPTQVVKATRGLCPVITSHSTRLKGLWHC